MLERFLNACEGQNGNTMTRNTDFEASLSSDALKQYETIVSAIRETAENMANDQQAQETVAGNPHVQEQWFKLNRMTNEGAAKTPSLAEAMKMLEFSGTNLAYPALAEGVADIPLRPHQVTGVASVLEMLASPLHISIVADSVGLGKTRLALGVIEEYSRTLELCPDFEVPRKCKWPLYPVDGLTRADLAPNLRGPAKPTLIIIPANASATWKAELALWERAGRLKAYYWLSDQKVSGGRADGDGRHLPASVAEFKKFLAGHDQKSAETVKTVVVCSSSCFARRSISYKPGFAKPKSTRHDDDDDGEPEAMSSDLAACSYSELQGLAGFVIIDEIHKYKSVSTLCHNSIVKLKPERLLGLTATPVWNTAVDLAGILSFVQITCEDMDDLAGADEMEVSRRNKSG
jgi:SNF2 family DNA or RNA helicase